MDTDRAYLLGLVIGGGIWGYAEDVFRIRLPYKQWGSYEANPQRAGQISQDVMRVVSPLFRAIYGLSISYDTVGSGEWNILCEGDLTDLRTELESFGIVCEGEVRKTANINSIVPTLVDENLKRRFIAGLADTIGSTKQSHRRFTDDKQMISFEINGFEYHFVCALCKLLHSIKCYPDQILWNHPNFHCGMNPYDKNWKKGFKLRVYLDQYDKFGAFAFASKATSTKQNIELENQINVAVPCEERDIKNPTMSCVHCDEDSPLLPEDIRGGHYIHNKHVCAVLGCEHAPYDEIRKILGNAENCINPFPIMVKGTRGEIESIISANPLYNNRNYRQVDLSVSTIFKAKKLGLMWGNGVNSGYPVPKIIRAIAFLIAASAGQLNGSRPKGAEEQIINGYLRQYPQAAVKCYLPELLTPMYVSMGEYSVLIGPNNPQVYRKLISYDESNRFKLKVRPITEDDLK